MEILRYILMGMFVLVCIVATVLVLLQEGRSQGLGAIAGAAESYWGASTARVRIKDVPWKEIWRNGPRF